MSSSLASLKSEADAAVARGEWSKAQALYEEAVSALENAMGDDELGERHLQVAKLNANLSMVCLKQHNSGGAEEHAAIATATAPSWGKAFARLGAAQQAKGALLDAADSYEKAMGAEESFMGCKSEHSKLTRSRRYCKLSLIRKFKEGAPNYDSYLEKEAANPYNAVAAMNEEQRGILEMLRSGRVLPDGSNPEKVKEQDLILYLAAVDAGLHVMSNFPEYDDHPFTCPGMRLWLLSHGRDNNFRGIGTGSESFDVYKDLLDFGSTDGAYSEKEKFWNVHNTLSCMILFNTNRDFEDHNLERMADFGFPAGDRDSWGPTITFKAYQKVGEFGDLECIQNSNFLVTLNYFVLARAQQPPYLRWDFTKRPGIYWDISQQQLKKSDDSKSILMMVGISEELTRFFIFWRMLDAVPRELYHYKWDG